MKIKFIILLFLTIVSYGLMNEISAVVLEDENKNEVSEACANQQYTITTSGVSQAVVLDVNTNLVLDNFYSFDGQIEVIFPLKTESVILLIQTLDEQNKSITTQEERLEVKINDCAEETVMEPYSYDQMKTKVSYEDNVLNFESAQGVKTTISQDSSFTKFKTDGEVEKFSVEIAQNGQKIQLREEIDNSINFYEIYPNKDKQTFYVRSVDSFEVKEISLDIFNWSDFKYILIMLLLVFITAIFRRRARRKYKKAVSDLKKTKRRR